MLSKKSVFFLDTVLSQFVNHLYGCIWFMEISFLRHWGNSLTLFMRSTYKVLYLKMKKCVEGIQGVNWCISWQAGFVSEAMGDDL